MWALTQRCCAMVLRGGAKVHSGICAFVYAKRPNEIGSMKN